MLVYAGGGVAVGLLGAALRGPFAELFGALVDADAQTIAWSHPFLIIPGILFGAYLAVLAHARCGIDRLGGWLLVLMGGVASWSSFRVIAFLYEFSDGRLLGKSYEFHLAGGVAGFFGAFLIMLSVASTVPGWRQPHLMILPILGALAGQSVMLIDFLQTHVFYPTFAVWQAAIAGYLALVPLRDAPAEVPRT